MMDSDRPSATDDAERRVEERREELDHHLDQLSEKLSPSKLAASAFDRLQPSDRIKSVVTNKPFIAAVVGAVLGLLALRRWRNDRSSKSSV